VCYYYIGINGKNKKGHLFWQTCPKCKEFIVCLKESDNIYVPQTELQDSDTLTSRGS
jgi:hypothetical protein